MVLLGIISTVIRALLSATTDPYLDNVVLSLRMESSDSYYNKVVLLMHMDDTGLTDVKGNTVTLNGNATRSVTQAKFGTYSAYFDGTGDYLTIPYSSGFSPSGDYTCECWIYSTDVTSLRAIIGPYTQVTNTLGWLLYQTATGGLALVIRDSGGTAQTFTSADNIIKLNTWHHVTWTRTGSIYRLFIDGVLVAKDTETVIVYVHSSHPLIIGRWDDIGTNTRDWQGYIDEVRLTKGVSRYIGNFIIPSAAFPEPTNTAIDDIGKTVTTYGNAQYSDTSKYGTGSFYFDGTGDYLSVADSTDWSFGTGDFTVEAWVRFDSSNPNYQTICSQFDTSSNWWFLRKEDNTTNKLSLYFIIGGTVKADYIMTNSWATWSSDTWYHIAMVRNGSSMYMFINGINQTLTATVPVSTNDMGNIASPLYIGSDTTYTLKGYIDDLRITKGVARYTSYFIPYKILTSAPAGDPYYNYTTLLLKMNGTNGGTTFTDNSYNPKTLTVYGNTNTSTTQLKYGTTSGYFDGTGDYLTAPDHVDWTLGTNDFTLEAWICPTGYPTNNGGYYKAVIIGQDTGSSRGFGFQLLGTASSLTSLEFVGLSDNTPTYIEVSANYSFNLNTWYHVATCRKGNLLYLFVNGILLNVGGTAFNINIQNSTTTLKIGSLEYDATYKYAFTGYIDDLRITRDVARYTNNFQLPGPHIAAIDPDTDQWWLNTVLALRMDGTHGSTTFTDLKGKTVTPYGNASISSAISKFGQSAYFDGTGDYLTIPASTDFDFGSGNFTIEFWFYPPTNVTSGMNLISRWVASGSNLLWDIGIDNNNTIYYQVSTSGAYQAGNSIGSSNNAFTMGIWNHVAFVRNGSTFTLYVQGVSKATHTPGAITLASGTTHVSIGRDGDGNRPFYGYIDDLRITKGIARYTSSFTPSEKPIPTYVIGPNHDPYWEKVVLANSFNTSLNEERTKVATVYGNATRSSTQRKFGTDSLYLDGTGDYITYPDSNDLNLTSGDFTIECWIYPTTLTTTYILTKDSIYGVNYIQYSLNLNSNGGIRGSVGSGTTTSSYQNLDSPDGVCFINAWTHIAFVKSGTTLYLFVNGILVNSATQTATMGTSNNVLSIGREPGDSAYFNGYIDDVRITKGIARYTASFELPTTPNILG